MLSYVNERPLNSRWAVTRPTITRFGSRCLRFVRHLIPERLTLVPARDGFSGARVSMKESLPRRSDGQAPLFPVSQDSGFRETVPD